MVLYPKRVVSSLLVGGELLPHVDTLKYHGILFTGNGRMEHEIDRQISEVAQLMDWLD